ncbi:MULTISPECIES: DUF2897 family protein [unclassified Vibrio]|uniref:DUF2897 family protein n=1 Tax=unclassified Vibrio TaxID=2614977 RepID=UPI0012678435|nr:MULTISPECIES: DUF2897 family protein [unclassified Vibrio]MCM5510880.1 DUF2897 family protein [Vibrio sp. SCSIO 43169]QFT35604.1 hypothetical protein FIU99_04130 [Vibrio sp. THAF64]QGM33503.1 hypothetical protein GGC04_04135 [Vibrio sp. THAF191d]QGN69005.1 hypothetical protein GGC03_04130 [Vibrio sp. THAF191c]
MELLTNPWVIIFIVLSVIIGNIAALKYTAKMKFGQTDKKARSQDEKPTEQEEKKDP